MLGEIKASATEEEVNAAADVGFQEGFARARSQGFITTGDSGVIEGSLHLRVPRLVLLAFPIILERTEVGGSQVTRNLAGASGGAPIDADGAPRALEMGSRKCPVKLVPNGFVVGADDDERFIGGTRNGLSRAKRDREEDDRDEGQEDP